MQSESMILEVNHFKEILQFAFKYKEIATDTLIIVEVPYSRYRKILSDYCTYHSIYVNKMLNKCNYYRHYIIDEEGIKFKIVKTDEKEIIGRCKNCDCGRDFRWINPDTNRCYYKEMIENNYLTKMKENE